MMAGLAAVSGCGPNQPSPAEGQTIRIWEIRLLLQKVKTNFFKTCIHNENMPSLYNTNNIKYSKHEKQKKDYGHDRKSM